MTQTPSKTVYSSKTNPSKLKDFLGKTYELNYSENYEEFLQQFEIKRKTINQAVNSKPKVMLTQENDEYILTTTYPEGRRFKLKFRLGEVLNRRRSNVYPARCVFFIEGNKLIEEQWVDEKKVVVEREFRKKDLLVTMEVNDVKCYRLFVVPEDSMHSIRTETSRRSLFWPNITQDNEKPKTEEPQPVQDTTVTVTGKKLDETAEEIEERNLCY